MTFLRQFFWVFCLLLVACNQPATPAEPGAPTNPTEPSDPDPAEDEFAATITLSANGQSDYTVTAIEGEAVTEEGNDPDWQLKVGERYKIVNPNSFHPLQFIDKQGQVLLIQNADLAKASFQSDTGVNVEVTSEGIIFTLTSELAAQLDRYQCYNHPGMVGNITTN